MSDPRIQRQAAVPAASPSAPRAAARDARPEMGRDQLAVRRRPGAAPQAFSWGRAWGHAYTGLEGELKAMVLAPFQHPLATLGMLAATTGLVMAAPMVGISAVALGNLMLAGFTVAALARMGTGVWAAWADHRRGRNDLAERDFEAVGAGGADLLATVGPAAAGKALTILARSEAGRAVAQVVATSKPGKAWAFARTSVAGRLRALVGQEGKLRALGDAARRLTAGLTGEERAQVTAGRLAGWRRAIADSGTVRTFNRAFEEVPAQLADALEGKALTALNYSKAGRSIRDWGLAKAAVQRGQSLEVLKAETAVRHAIPAVTSAAKQVSPTLSRGPVPMTDADFQFLVKQQKVRTVVSLLHPNNPLEVDMLAQERALAAKYGVKLINIPLPFGVDPPPDMVARFLATVDAATPNTRVYVHCKLGRDRTGTMVAVFRQAREGVTGQEALAEMERFGFDPVRDSYLSYLARYVLSYAQRGARGLGRIFLYGTAGEAAAAARKLAAADVAASSKR